MIDANLDVFLIEINSNPCLELSCPLLASIIPKMVENALEYLSRKLDWLWTHSFLLQSDTVLKDSITWSSCRNRINLNSSTIRGSKSSTWVPYRCLIISYSKRKTTLSKIVAMTGKTHDYHLFFCFWMTTKYYIFEYAMETNQSSSSLSPKLKSSGLQFCAFSFCARPYLCSGLFIISSSCSSYGAFKASY